LGLPPADVTLFASKASLVVRKDLHPAIQYLLLSTAVQIHSGVSMFHRAGRFPAAEGIELPLSSQAVQFYKPRANSIREMTLPARRPSRRGFFFGRYFLCRCADVAFSVALSAWMRPSSAASFVS
jgi:hypothetical protein